ncbi:MAG TPA: diaminopimelate epimerase [Gemmatimonadales bacterium]|nr:diaminopimelate epimerase [Gemmatimonadales bacterium]
MSGARFYKMTGSGNDFVFLDGREHAAADWPAERIRAACDRRRGIGADGLVILSPAADGAVRMSYFNADGGEAAMCGNAALCSTRLAVRLALAPGAAGDELQLLTRVGPVAARPLAGDELAEIRLPDFPLPTPVPAIALEPGERWLLAAKAGVPHLVVRVGDVSTVDVARRGRQLRRDPATGGEGANANFVSPPVAGPDGAEGRWRIRTFERGVEGETLACGTGTVATALALHVAGEAGLPVRFVSWGGSPLSVRARVEDGWARDVWLGGEGRLVFEGRLAD